MRVQRGSMQFSVPGPKRLKCLIVCQMHCFPKKTHPTCTESKPTDKKDENTDPTPSDKQPDIKDVILNLPTFQFEELDKYKTIDDSVLSNLSYDKNVNNGNNNEATPRLESVQAPPQKSDFKCSSCKSN